MTSEDHSPPNSVEDAAEPIDKIVIRPSRDDDVEAMLDIYRQHVLTGVEREAWRNADLLQADDLKRRRKNLRNKRLPHLVATLNRVVVGYAYVVPFRKRPAYRYALKHSIYVHREHLGAGVGRILLPALIDACAAAGFRQVIGYIDASNLASIRLHESFGFTQVGRLPNIGWKFGHWTDSLMMQRSLGLGGSAHPDF